MMSTKVVNDVCLRTQQEHELKYGNLGEDESIRRDCDSVESD